MAAKLPFTVVQSFAALWSLFVSAGWLNAVMNQMPEAFIGSFVVVIVATSALGAYWGRWWARSVLILLSWGAAIMWFVSGFSLHAAQVNNPDHTIVVIVFGLICTGMAVILHYTEREPK